MRPVQLWDDQAQVSVTELPLGERRQVSKGATGAWAVMGIVQGTDSGFSVATAPWDLSGSFHKGSDEVFASIICVVSFPVGLHFIFTGFISPSWLEVGHCRIEFNSWRRLNIIYSILPYVFSSFATAWFSLPVEKSETVSISSVFSLGMCFSWKVYSSKPFNCPCLLLRKGMPS